MTTYMTEPITEGDSIRLAEQASIVQIAVRADQLGEYSPWDSSVLNQRMDSQTTALVRDAVRASRQQREGGVRMDAPFAPGARPEAYTAYDPDFVMQDYEETLYADPGFLAMKDLSRPGVNRVVVQSVNRTGRFKTGGDRTTNTEALDAGMNSIEYPSQYIYAHVTYTTRELDAMQEAKRNGNVFGFLDIIQYKMTEVVEMAYKEEMNRINSGGIPSLGIYGLHTHFGLPRIASPIALDAASTPDEYITVFRAGVQAIINNSGKRLRGPSVAIIPSEIRTEMQSRLIGTSGSVSVLDWLMRSFGITEIYTPPQADTAGSDGGAAIHLMVNNPGNTMAMVTKKLTQDGRPYKQDGVWRSDFHAAAVGVVLKKPYEHVLIEGVLA